MDRLTVSEVRTMLAACPRVGSRWRHAETGHEVEVLGGCLREVSFAPWIRYLHDGIEIVRPLAEWQETVLNAAGEQVPRFTLVEG